MKPITVINTLKGVTVNVKAGQYVNQKEPCHAKSPCMIQKNCVQVSLTFQTCIMQRWNGYRNRNFYQPDEILINRHLYASSDKNYKDKHMAAMSLESIGNIFDRNGPEIKENCFKDLSWYYARFKSFENDFFSVAQCLLNEL